MSNQAYDVLASLATSNIPYFLQSSTSTCEDSTSLLPEEKSFEDSPLTSGKRAPRRLKLDSDSDSEEICPMPAMVS